MTYSQDDIHIEHGSDGRAVVIEDTGYFIDHPTLEYDYEIPAELDDDMMRGFIAMFTIMGENMEAKRMSDSYRLKKLEERLL